MRHPPSNASRATPPSRRAVRGSARVVRAPGPVTRALAASALALVGVGCTLTPLLPQSSARSLPPGETTGSLYALPAVGAVISHGLTERIDVGVDVEQSLLAAAWGKYTLVEGPRFAAAIEARAFAGTRESHARAAGVGVGPVIEIGGTGPRLVLGARLNRLRHDVSEDDGEWFDFGFEPEPGDDFGTIVQAWGFVQFGTRRFFRLGAACEHYPSDDPDTGSGRSSGLCLPTIGIGSAVR